MDKKYKLPDQNVYHERPLFQQHHCNEQFDESNDLETHVSTGKDPDTFQQNVPLETPLFQCHLCNNFRKHTT